MDPAEGNSSRVGALSSVVVASDQGHRFGVVVACFPGERDLCASLLDVRLGNVPSVNNSSVLEDGQSVLVVGSATWPPGPPIAAKPARRAQADPGRG